MYFVDIANECPSTHPWSYYEGDYCCATNKEKINPPDGQKCDGSALEYDSVCCEDDDAVSCPDPPCKPTGKLNNLYT